MKTYLISFVVVAVVAFAAWFWWMHLPVAPSTPAVKEGVATTTPKADQQSGTMYAAGNLLLGTDAKADLGTYLIGSNGMTLYTYAPDTDSVSNCNGACAVNWPPYLIPSSSVLANVQAGITGKVSAVTRADGSLQVAYNGAPVYFYGGDTVSGDTKGQGVGGIWYIVKP